MCGITGYFAPDSRVPDRGRLERAVTVLRHRGPDDSGTWEDSAGIGLGQTRLGILDLSALGHQPMFTPDGRHAIVFNGEIYNFREIRRDLELLGSVFKGSGDTEVVLAALRTWGLAAVDRFVGMFAIAWWCADERRLTLIRDRLGVKPLYYGWDGHTLLFGSELKALRELWTDMPPIDRQALGEYFQFGYVAAPRTIYRGIHKLPPGHSLVVTPGSEPRAQAYWSVCDAAAAPHRGTEAEIEEELEALLISAFRYRLVSDVPVGVFLSGGIDSTLVTALLQHHSGRTIRTFTIGFDDAAVDESPHAAAIAKHLGTDHTLRILSGKEAMAILPTWAGIFDEPFGDSSGIPTFLVSRVAREEVKVALSADGGDELFGGYTSYGLMPRRVALLRRVPRWVRDAAPPVLRLVSRFVSSGSALPLLEHLRLADRLAKLETIFPGVEPAVVFETGQSSWLAGDIRQLVGDYRTPRIGADAYAGTFEEQMMLWDLHHYLPDDILAKVDRATMAVSLEGREPMLDHRLVEFAFRLPLHLRRGALGSKHLLRKILYRYVPRELVDRPKHGFGVPLGAWLKADLAPLLDEYLAPARIAAAGLLDPALVARAVSDFRRGSVPDVNRVWLLLAFELWREAWN